MTNLLDFAAPADSAVSISPLGDVELKSPFTNNAAFYRIEVD